MSNHLHLIVSAKEGNNLSDILRDFKKFTSSQIIKAIENNTKESRRNWMLWLFKSAGEKNNRNKNYQFWQQDNHPIECFNNEILQSRMIYLHQNPVRAGIVVNERDYIYSSAKDYYKDEKGLIAIDYI
jgi:REP element-mobilizing transposase RayT